MRQRLVWGLCTGLILLGAGVATLTFAESGPSAASTNPRPAGYGFEATIEPVNEPERAGTYLLEARLTDLQTGEMLSNPHVLFKPSSESNSIEVAGPNGEGIAFSISLTESPRIVELESSVTLNGRTIAFFRTKLRLES